MKPIIYESTDAGAPQLSAAAGTMNAVIKACLVTGYGDKLAAGWEIAYENLANKNLAIRSTAPKSINSVLLIADTESSNATVKAYLDWNEVDNIGISAFDNRIFPKVLGSNSTPKWVVVATDSFFYIWVQHTALGANYGVISAFGDVLPVGLNDNVSVLLTKAAGGTGEFFLGVSSGNQARIPRVPMQNNDVGFGDVSTNTNYKSDIAVFSRFVIYMFRNSQWQPTFELPGVLMPYAEKEYKPSDPIVFKLENQTPYIHPLIALHQPYQGNFWLHTDNWG